MALCRRDTNADPSSSSPRTENQKPKNRNAVGFDSLPSCSAATASMGKIKTVKRKLAFKGCSDVTTSLKWKTATRLTQAPKLRLPATKLRANGTGSNEAIANLAQTPRAGTCMNKATAASIPAGSNSTSNFIRSDNTIASFQVEDIGFMPTPPSVTRVLPDSEDIELPSDDQILTPIPSVSLIPSNSSIQTEADANRQGILPTSTPVTPRATTSVRQNYFSPVNISPILQQLNDRIEDPVHELDPVTPPQKRKCDPSEWQAVKAKRAHNAGQGYTSVRGKAVPPKQLRPGCSEKCKMKCKLAITEEQRQRAFRQYWKLGSPELQWQHLYKRVQVTSVKRRSADVLEGENARRNNTYKYSLLADNLSVSVCQTMFLATFSVSKQVLHTAIEKGLQYDINGADVKDGRGKSKGSRNKRSAKMMESVKEHIKKFPRVPGHFTRKSSSFFYLASGLNVQNMHAMYAVERQTNGQTECTASLNYYRKVFRSYKLKFLRPKKDQCSECLSFKNKAVQEKTSDVKEKQKAHLRRALITRAQKKLDSCKAKRDKTICVATFDLQSVLQCPKGESSEFYYKTRLNCFNFTIYDAGNGQGYCYFWDQTVGKKGSNEISSHLYSFITAIVANGVKEFRFYSDNCFSQNKNRSLYALYYFLSQKLQIWISHIYLEKGHTQMECDSMHAAVERRSKRETIYTPSEWCAQIRMAKLTDPRYMVKEVTRNDIFDAKALAEYLNWDQVPTSQLREVLFSSTIPSKMSFRLEFGQPLKSVKITTSPTTPMPALKMAYTGRLPLRPRQFKDLIWLWDKHHIARSAERFYLDLKAWSKTVPCARPTKAPVSAARTTTARKLPTTRNPAARLQPYDDDVDTDDSLSDD